MGRRKKPGEVADQEEIKRFLTAFVRGSIMEESVRKVGSAEERVLVPPKITDRLKACEMLLKLDECGREDSQPLGDAAREARALLADMRERISGRSGTPADG